MRNGFVFYKSYYDAMKTLPAEQQAALLQAVCDYAYEGAEPHLEGMAGVIFGLIAPTLEASCKRHELAVKGAKARWDPKPAPQPQAEAEQISGQNSEHKSGQKSEQTPPEPPKNEKNSEQPAPPLPKNVSLTPGQQEALRREIPDAENVIRQYAAYKKAHLREPIFDEPAIRYFAEYDWVPVEGFVPKSHPAQWISESRPPKPRAG